MLDPERKFIYFIECGHTVWEDGAYLTAEYGVYVGGYVESTGEAKASYYAGSSGFPVEAYADLIDTPEPDYSEIQDVDYMYLVCPHCGDTSYDVEVWTVEAWLKDGDELPDTLEVDSSEIEELSQSVAASQAEQKNKKALADFFEELINTS